MAGIVGKCRKLSEIVGNCRKMSENVGKCRGAMWGGPHKSDNILCMEDHKALTSVLDDIANLDNR